MFDIGFWEMAFIGVIALVVIGPERLPGVARTAGLWVGKARRMPAVWSRISRPTSKRK
jgi:sec-independent protein translocase protein TatB